MQSPQNWFNTTNLQAFQPSIPREVEPIILTPISPLSETSFFSQAILKQIGFLNSVETKQVTNSNFFSNLFSCGECGCKALSRETLSEINNQMNIEKENEQHLKDMPKKQKYLGIWNQKHTEGKSLKTKSDFQSAYRKFGYVGEEEWRREIESL